MDYHHHARLTIHSRERLAQKVLAGEVSLNSAAAEFKLSRQSAAKWVRRFREGGLAALQDRSSRPHRSPRTTSAELASRVEVLRRERWLRPGNVHSAEDWDELLLPEIERQRAEGKEVAFRADAAFAKPEIYEALEERGVKYAIRIPANDSLERGIAELLTRHAGRPSHKPVVWYKGFLYQAASWKTAGGGEGGVSLRGTVPASRLYRHKSEPAQSGGDSVLQ